MSSERFHMVVTHEVPDDTHEDLVQDETDTYSCDTLEEIKAVLQELQRPQVLQLVRGVALEVKSTFEFLE